ncbi:hypothetical protein HHK36_026543 [Tetracentron sinense]|uniref:Uncharacterized protein n=1 Tax=Tetracentron sinense TaxID=13715 RepID=A0A834YIX6_TETSI|nr:hypothetical protein HHK36_026543 [Tetracentron sinense]
MNGSCSFSLENSYKLKYKTTIKGIISKDLLTKLKGVSVKVLLLSFDIIELVRRGDELEFSVGIASANFPTDKFEECPQCGCGFNCVNEQKKKERKGEWIRMRGSTRCGGRGLEDAGQVSRWDGRDQGLLLYAEDEQ